MIEVKFPDGVYQFWQAYCDDGDKRIYFRVKITGEGGNRSPRERLENLIKELGAAGDPEAAITYSRYTKFRPADMTGVIAWMVGHRHDLYDLIDMICHKKIDGET